MCADEGNKPSEAFLRFGQNAVACLRTAIAAGVALFVDLDGGYMNFVDNVFDSEEYKLLLCHKCAHEFVNF